MTTNTYPEQLMLPGQTAAPEGPVDMTMMYLMHHGFRRDLDRFAAAAPATPVDDLATWVALAERWGWFSEILHKHHTGEDTRIWPYLLERADDGERQTLLDMEAEHARIDPILTACGELFAALAGLDGSSGERSREELRAALSVRLTETKELLAGHLRHEETGAIAILQRHTTPEDWKRIEDQLQNEEKNTFAFLRYAVNWIAEDLPKDALDHAFAKEGQGFRVVKWLGRRGFRQLESRAFRYAA